MSVESCHHYPSLDSFFVEAYRVLRPGGRLCLASYFPPAAVRRLRTAMVAAPLHVTEVEDLTAGVQRSVATTQDFKSSPDRSLCPSRMALPVAPFLRGAGLLDRSFGE